MNAWLSISGIVVIVAMIVVTVFLWKVAKLLLVPIHILLFLLLLFIAYRLFCPSNARNEKIDGMIRQASDSAVRYVKKKAAEKLAPGKENTSPPPAGAPAQ